MLESQAIPQKSDDHTTNRDCVLKKKLPKTSIPKTQTSNPHMVMTLAARNKAPAMDKLAMDELAMDELAKKELVTEGFATDELATDALLQVLASKLGFVPLVELKPPKETKSITNFPGPTTIPWRLRACRETSA